MGMGFSFKYQHSSTFGISVKNDDRTALVEKTSNRYTIGGKDGSIDYGTTNYKDRVITCSLLLNTCSYQELRTKVRDIAQWLSTKGLLVFDDEPDVGYVAQVYQGVSLEELYTNGITSITFLCSPFAETLQTFQYIKDFTVNGESVDIDYQGTASACIRIKLTNTGTTDVTGIRVTRVGDIY